VANFQGMQFQYADAATSIEAARLLVLNAARLKDSGQPFTKQAAMAKLAASRVAEEVASNAIEWMGGNGFVRVMIRSFMTRISKKLTPMCIRNTI
jgi:short/branched chain acyl-CoA dehydrogenase